MTFLQQAASAGVEGFTVAISFGATYYVGLVLLSIIMIVLFVHAYRVWEEIHDEEAPASPADLLDSFEQAHAEGELDAQELDRLRMLLRDGQGTGGERTVAPPGPKPTKAARSEASLTNGGALPIDPSHDDTRGGAS